MFLVSSVKSESEILGSADSDAYSSLVALVDSLPLVSSEYVSLVELCLVVECVELAESVRCETQEENTGTIMRKKIAAVTTINSMSLDLVREVEAVAVVAVPPYCAVGGAGTKRADCGFGAGAAKFWRPISRGGAACAGATAGCVAVCDGAVGEGRRDF